MNFNFWNKIKENHSYKECSWKIIPKPWFRIFFETKSKKIKLITIILHMWWWGKKNIATLILHVWWWGRGGGWWGWGERIKAVRNRVYPRADADDKTVLFIYIPPLPIFLRLKLKRILIAFVVIEVSYIRK